MIQYSYDMANNINKVYHIWTIQVNSEIMILHLFQCTFINTHIKLNNTK